MAKIHTVRNSYNKNFVVTLALLPLTIQLIIMLVNGNVGTGVAVMGAFSLVRFRSLPGTAKEIGSIFATMAVGLAVGTSQVLVAVLFTAIFAIISLTYEFTNFFESNNRMQSLKITIPEDLYTEGVFDTVLADYTKSHKLDIVRTTNMGTLFQLCYTIYFDESKDLKLFFDELRCRNGNLDINYNLLVGEENGL